MSHSFTVIVTDTLAERLKNTASEITGSGGSFEGNMETGTFRGNSFLGPITGEYCRISECEIKFTITDKPLIVPYSMIESEIKKYFT
jgi:hypothetical protein